MPILRVELDASLGNPALIADLAAQIFELREQLPTNGRIAFHEF